MPRKPTPKQYEARIAALEAANRKKDRTIADQNALIGSKDKSIEQLSQTEGAFERLRKRYDSLKTRMIIGGAATVVAGAIVGVFGERGAVHACPHSNQAVESVQEDAET